MGYNQPSNFPLSLNTNTGSTAVIAAPYIDFNSGFGRLIGFNATTFPASPLSRVNGVSASANSATLTTFYSTAAASTLSTKTPQINPIDSVLLRCNVANNANSMPNDLISITPISSSYGALTQYMASTLLYVPCSQTVSNSIQLIMCDQTLTPILQRDNELTVVLSIRTIAK